MTISLGATARSLRESLGLTQRATARMLGISFVHLCNIEKERAAPSQNLIDKYRELWGVDLYVLAWCKNGELSKLPRPLRDAASQLSKTWTQYIEETIANNRSPHGD